MNLVEATIWINSGIDHYILLEGIPVRKLLEEYTTDKMIPVMKVNEMYYHIKYVAGTAIVDYDKPVDYV